jgi:pimeloyl-ACP methyl ester carboxylesterase
MAYHLSGDTGDDLLVLIHGFGCTGSVFDSAFESPELSGLRRLAVDLIGHGRSGRSDDASYDHLVQAKIIADLIDEIAATRPVSRVHVFAHSMGNVPGLLLGSMLERRGYNLGAFISLEGVMVYQPGRATVVSEAAEMSLEDYRRRGFPNLLAALYGAGGDHLQWADWCREASVDALWETAVSTLEWVTGCPNRATAMFNNWPGNRAWYVHHKLEAIRLLFQGALRPDSLLGIGGDSHFPMFDPVTDRELWELTRKLIAS